MCFFFVLSEKVFLMKNDGNWKIEEIYGKTKWEILKKKMLQKVLEEKYKKKILKINNES